MLKGVPVQVRAGLLMAKYSKQILERAVENAASMAAVLRNLGLAQAGGTHSHIAKKLKELNIDTSHFLGKGASRGKNHKGGSEKKHFSEILVLRKDNCRTKSFQLRRALIESGRKYECEKCQLKEWNGKILTLHVDHKNGNYLDNRKRNVRFLCPNCHSQTFNYCKPKGK